MPDVAAIRAHLLESMDLSSFGIRPVFISSKSHLWSVDGKEELLLTVDDALHCLGLQAFWKDGTVQGGLCIERIH